MTLPATITGRISSTCRSTARRRSSTRYTAPTQSARHQPRSSLSLRARCLPPPRRTTTMATATLEKTADPRITSAIGHWGPRFVTNGVALTDFEEVTASIASWDDWCRAWSARAAVHEEMGREALARKKFVSAGEHLQRAGVYYHFGKFLFVQDLAQMKAAHLKAVECRKLAAPYLRPPGERVEMPYEGKWLAGILRKPVGAGRPPVVAFACGLDSCKEETDAYEAPFLARGSPFDWGECFANVPDLTREAFRVRSKSATIEEARRKAATLSLKGVAQNITCPIYIMNGKLDRIVPAKDSERLANEVKGPVVLNLVDEGNHIANNRAYCWRTQSADWMAEQLGVG